MADDDAQTFAEWVILEQLGHRRLAGHLTEQQIAGHGFLRLDIPGDADTVHATQLLSPASVYAIHPTTEAIARHFAATHRPAPVQRWELPAAAAPEHADAVEDGPHDYGDDRDDFYDQDDDQ